MDLTPFEFSFLPRDRQLVLQTGAVPSYRLEEVRAEIKAHTDFSAEINKVDRKKNPVENYFLKVVATGLGKNPTISAEDKRDIVKTIRMSLVDKGKGN